MSLKINPHPDYNKYFDIPLVASIRVTKEDLENGIRFDCEACPIALAVKRWAVNLGLGVQSVSVGAGGVVLELATNNYGFYNTYSYLAESNHDVKRFLETFDFRPYEIDPETELEFTLAFYLSKEERQYDCQEL